MSTFLVVNIFVLIYCLDYFFAIPGYLSALSTNLLLFIFPGWAWIGGLGKRLAKNDPVINILIVVSISLLVCILSIVGHLLVNRPAGPLSHLAILVVVTNAGLLINRTRPKVFTNSRVLICLFLMVFSLSYLYSSHIADRPFEDSDLDLQGTSFGLITQLKPRMLTDRKTIYNFSRPLLPAFCSANTALLFGDLNELEYYFRASLEAEEIENRSPRIGEMLNFISDQQSSQAQIVQVNGEKVKLDAEIIDQVEYSYGKYLPAGAMQIDYNLVKEMRIWHLVKDCYNQFFEQPLLLSTRTPQFLFTGLCGVVLFWFLFQLSNSFALSLAGSIFYLAIPEIFLAHSSTNYTASSSFVLIAAAYCYFIYFSDQKNSGLIRACLFLAGFLCAITNHKTLVLFLAILIKDIIATIRLRAEKPFGRPIYRDYLLLGFACGTIAYWCYGFAIDGDTFILDHLQYHLFNRLFHRNPFGYTGYFSVPELWLAYSANLGQPFLWFSLIPLVYFLKNISKSDDRASTISLWFIIGALCFTIIDYKQTVHLIYISPALVVLSLKWLQQTAKTIRILWLAILSYVLCSNVWTILETIWEPERIFSILRWL